MSTDGIAAGGAAGFQTMIREANPFTAFKIRWTAGEREIAAAADALSTDLKNAQKRDGLSPIMTKLVAKALDEVARTRGLLSTAEGRRRARSLYMPADQIEQASEQARPNADQAIAETQAIPHVIRCARKKNDES